MKLLFLSLLLLFPNPISFILLMFYTSFLLTHALLKDIVREWQRV